MEKVGTQAKLERESLEEVEQQEFKDVQRGKSGKGEFRRKVKVQL